MLAISGFVLNTNTQEAGTYNPGTHRATGKGRGGDVVVEARFDKDSIKSVDIVPRSKTRYIPDMPTEALPGPNRGIPASRRQLRGLPTRSLRSTRRQAHRH